MKRAGTPASPGRRAAGFTLVEVLVALAIVAITLSAGLKAAGALTDNAQRLAEVTVAQWCADNMLTNLRLAHQFPNTGETDFECKELGREYKGRLRVQASANPNFRIVEAAVLDDGGTHAIVMVSTVMGRYAR